MSEERRRILTRRDFVRGTVGTAMAASVLGPSRLLHAQDTSAGDAAGGAGGGEVAPPVASGRSRVVVIREKGVMDDRNEVDLRVLSAMLATAVTRVTGQPTAEEAWAALVRPDDVVGLVTTNFMNPTRAELVGLVTRALIEAGVAEDRVLDAQGGTETIKRCTALLCMPAMKAHWLTGIGTVIKNYIMFSGKPASYHKADSAKLGEIWQLPDVAGKTRLVLVDALRPMCSKGPQPDPRYRWRYRGLIAGTDPVAVETTCLRVIENKRTAIRGEPWPLSPPPICVQAADETYGLGISNPDHIDVERIGWDEGVLI